MTTLDGVEAELLTIFLGGDAMTGRGVDQILAHPGSPELREPAVGDARTYRRLAEGVNGPISVPVDFGWPWGDALASLDANAPAVRIVNLETSITRSDDFAAGKAVHYRMHPSNVACLTAGRIDVCALANNHVLDFGHEGLVETLEVLSSVGIGWVGAGRDANEAREPAILAADNGRVIVCSVGAGSSGIPRAWAAGAGTRPGLDLLPDLSDEAAFAITDAVRSVRRSGDVAVASIHWGPNWGFEVSRHQVRFAHRLVDGGVDVVHGHSSHHPLPIELYRDRLVLYGCGGLIDDYEGIAGHEEDRPDLRLLYFASLEPVTGRVVRVRLVPLQARRMQLRHASARDSEWLRALLDRVSRPFASHVVYGPEGTLTLQRERGR